MTGTTPNGTFDIRPGRTDYYFYVPPPYKDELEAAVESLTTTIKALKEQRRALRAKLANLPQTTYAVSP